MTYLKSAQYGIAAFIAGFSLMVVEIISSRIVAPLIGSSIFTWTALIGITLLGLSVGSFAGGEIADRYSKVYGQKVLAVAFLAAAFFVYAVIPLSKHMGPILEQSFSILALSIIVSLALFLLPAVTIGMLSPIIFKSYVGDITHIGKKYGLLSSLWSLGSIVGVFMAGFYFIPNIGSSSTLYLIAAILLAAFYFFYSTDIKRHSPQFERHIAVLIIVSACIGAIAVGGIYQVKIVPPGILFQKETAYYDMRVVDYNLYPQFGKNRILLLDIDAHSIQTAKPSKEFYTDIAPAFSIFTKTVNTMYVIGAGAYTLPINLRKYYPQAQISVGDIDPELEKIGRDYFNLGAYNIQTEVGDARVKFNDTRSGEYDLIYGDAYNSFISVPWYLLTKEFTEETKTHLTPNGIYAINFIGALEGPQAKMFESVYSTIHGVFPSAYIFAFGADRTKIQNITIIGLKNDEKIPYAEAAKKLQAIDATGFLSGALVDKDSLNNSTGIHSGLILTDDFSPIETMMIGLMNEYFPRYLLLYEKMIS